ncbi:MAG TPA: hypothetical protein VF178_16810 [Gemmatimonadaceae bacterium]
MTQPSVSEYFIEKHRMPVTLLLTGGERVSGQVFTQASWRGMTDLEDAWEFMNGEDSFFPFGTAAGTRLVAKAHVLALETSIDNVSPARRELGTPTSVRVTLAGGFEFSGQLWLEEVVARARVLDYLNHTRDPFIAVYQSKLAILLNRRHVVFVTPEETGHGHDA